MGYAIEYKEHPDANYNPFPVQYYCYENNCTGREKYHGSPHSEGSYKWTTVISKKGNSYRRKRWICDHCGKVMTGTVSMYVFG